MADIDDVYDKCNDILDRLDDVEEKIDELEMYAHITCPVCQGTGEVNDPVDGEPGPPYTCPRCDGDGTLQSSSLDQTAE